MTAFMTPRELAERWSCDPSYVRKLGRSGALPGMRLGTDWRFSLAAIEAYERGHTSASAEAGPELPPAPKEVTYTTSVDGFALPADYEPVFADLWPGHEPTATKRRPRAATRSR